MKDLDKTLDGIRKAQKAGTVPLSFNLVHKGGNKDRTDPRDPLKGSAPASLPFSSRRMVTGSRTFTKFSGVFLPPRDYSVKQKPDLPDINLTRRQVDAEFNRYKNPQSHYANRYDPIRGNDPSMPMYNLGLGARRMFSENGPGLSALAFAGLGGTAGWLAGRLGKGGGASPGMLALLGALAAGGVGYLGGKAFGKRASAWLSDTGSVDQLSNLVRKAADLDFRERVALERAVSSMSSSEAASILRALGPSLGGAGLGALLARLILGKGGGRAATGALLGYMAGNLLKGRNEGNVNIYGGRLAI
jgi:hypothetical protein